MERPIRRKPVASSQEQLQQQQQQQQQKQQKDKQKDRDNSEIEDLPLPHDTENLPQKEPDPHNTEDLKGKGKAHPPSAFNLLPREIMQECVCFVEIRTAVGANPAAGSSTPLIPTPSTRLPSLTLAGIARRAAPVSTSTSSPAAASPTRPQPPPPPPPPTRTTQTTRDPCCPP